MAHHDPPQLPRWKRFYTGMAPLARVNFGLSPSLVTVPRVQLKVLRDGGAGVS
jgi:hypothetical protein